MTIENNQRSCFFRVLKVAKISKLYSYETAQYNTTDSILRSHAAFEFRDRSVINKLLYVLQNLTMKILEFNPFY